MTQYKPNEVVVNMPDGALDPEEVRDPKTGPVFVWTLLRNVLPYALRDKLGWNRVLPQDVDPMFMLEAETAEHSPQTMVTRTLNKCSTTQKNTTLHTANVN